MKLLFKYTSRSRPARFFKGLDSIVAYVNGDYHIQCTFDTDDKTMNNKTVIDRLNKYKNLSYYFGVSTGKINAINRDIDKFPPFDILINMSDDFVFIKPFGDIIREAFKNDHFGKDGFIHFHDGKQNRLATMSIIGYSYFKIFNYIYHPDYISVWCDNEAQEVAKRLSRYLYMGDSVKIMMHEHPLHGGGMNLLDEQYRQSESFYKQDKETYQRRLALNFDLCNPS